MKYGTTDGRVRRFDLEWLREHYKITLPELIFWRKTQRRLLVLGEGL